MAVHFSVHFRRNERCSPPHSTRYKAYLSPDNSWGYFLPNGTVTGILGMVARREVDLAVSALGITQEREKVVDFTAPYMGTHSMLFSRFPKEKGRALAVLSPFQFQVWICLAAAVLFLGPVAYLVSYAVTKYKYQEADEKLDLNWYTFNAFRSIVLQGNYIEAGSWPTRFILFVWFVFCLIFYALYSGVLTAVLAVPTYETPIDSLNDLPRAAQEGFTIGMLGGSSYNSFFKMAKEGIYKQTWDLLDHNDGSKSFVNNLDEGFRRVLAERFVFIAGESYMKMILRRFGKGQYHFGREVFFPVYVGFACQSGSPIAHVFTQWILRLQASGLIVQWIDTLFKQIPRDPAAKEEGEAKSFAITLTHLQAGFYLTFLGLSVATVVFLLELVIFYTREKELQLTDY
ncbi:glutamate receptor ionotropic, delta-2-like [Macrobrachium rosenbergii]|uniref:glutamate receptor ionotropic, delta-2-like n=1 Tax=Macrobrachium rosenbergii TaxID=79674 RepID=UPI0034D491B4